MFDPTKKAIRFLSLDRFVYRYPSNINLKGISKNPYYLFGLTFNSSPLERKRSVFRDALKLF